MLKHLPNTLTLINLFCGALAVVSIFHLHVEEALIFQGISLVTDFLDGMLARKLKVNSPLGIQLDSLADVVSFGVFPGAVVYITLVQALNIDPSGGDWLDRAMLYPAFILTVFAGLRLGRFNISDDQSDKFIGLPTPAMGMFFTGWLLIQKGGNIDLISYLKDSSLIYLFIILFSYLMNSKIVHFKIKFNKETLSNPYILLLLGSIVGMGIFYPYVMLSASILLYILFSIISNFVKI